MCISRHDGDGSGSKISHTTTFGRLAEFVCVLLNWLPLAVLALRLKLSEASNCVCCRRRRRRRQRLDKQASEEAGPIGLSNRGATRFGAALAAAAAAPAPTTCCSFARAREQPSPPDQLGEPRGKRIGLLALEQRALCCVDASSSWACLLATCLLGWRLCVASIGSCRQKSSTRTGSGRNRGLDNRDQRQAGRIVVKQRQQTSSSCVANLLLLLLLLHSGGKSERANERATVVKPSGVEIV